MGETFDRKVVGDRISADEYNRLTDAVERADGMAVSGASLSRRGGATSLAVANASPFLVVRMLSDSVVQENARRAAAGGQLPPLYNAIRQKWNDRADGWMDAPEQLLWVDNPCGVPVPQDDWAVCCTDPGSGRTILIPNGVIQLAVTVADPNLSGSGAPSGSGDGGSGGFSGDYPPESLRPSTYCINFVGLPYPPIPGVNRVPADGNHAAADEVPTSVFGPSGRPHATVMNLYQGGDSYLKEGTVIWCFMAGGKWYTYMMKPAADAAVKLYATVTELLYVTPASAGSGSGTEDDTPIVYDGCGRALARLETTLNGCTYVSGLVPVMIVIAPYVGALLVGRRYEVSPVEGATVTLVSVPTSGSGTVVSDTRTGVYPVYAAQGHVRQKVLADMDVTCVSGVLTKTRTYKYVWVAAVESG